MRPILILPVLLSLLSTVAFAQSNQFIPHIRQGVGWSTAFHVFNLCSSPSQYDVFLRGPDGELKEFSFADGMWARFKSEEFAAKGVHYWYFPPTEQERFGYGEIVDDGDGCVKVDTFYVQHMGSDNTWSVISPSLPLSSTGVVIPFLGFKGCDSEVAIIGAGEEVSVEAVKD